MGASVRKATSGPDHGPGRAFAWLGAAGAATDRVSGSRRGRRAERLGSRRPSTPIECLANRALETVVNPRLRDFAFLWAQLGVAA